MKTERIVLSRKRSLSKEDLEKVTGGGIGTSPSIVELELLAAAARAMVVNP